MDALSLDIVLERQPLCIEEILMVSDDEDSLLSMDNLLDPKRLGSFEFGGSKRHKTGIVVRYSSQILVLVQLHETNEFYLQKVQEIKIEYRIVASIKDQCCI